MLYNLKMRKKKKFSNQPKKNQGKVKTVIKKINLQRNNNEYP